MIKLLKQLCGVTVGLINFKRNLVEAKPYLAASPEAYHHLMNLISSSDAPLFVRRWMFTKVREAVSS